MLNEDVLARIAAAYSEDQLLDILDIDTVTLVEMLTDKIEENIHLFKDLV